HLDISRSRGHYFGGRCWCHGISGRRGRRVGMARKKSPRAPRAAARDRGSPAATPSPINKAAGEPGKALPGDARAATTPPSRDTFPVVGIGASAGGLEAFSELLSHLAVEATMAFVLIQHEGHRRLDRQMRRSEEHT